MKYTNDWSDLLATLTEDIPAEELEADILLADIAGKNFRRTDQARFIPTGFC